MAREGMPVHLATHVLGVSEHRRDQDARSAGIGPTATRIRIEAERLEERTRRLRAQIGPSTPTSRPSVDTTELARRRDALVARSTWDQVRRRDRR
jgi:hypothetical protein